MLIIPDQWAVRVGGQRRLARPRQAEEQRNVRWMVRVHVRRTVHRKDAHIRQVVVHRVEDGLLDLTGIMRADNHHLALRKRLQNRARRVQAEFLVVFEAQLAGVDDRPVRLESRQLVCVGVDEQRLGKQTVPRLLRHHRNAKSIVRISAGVSIKPKQLSSLRQVRDRHLFDATEDLRGDGQIHLAPVDVAVNVGRILEELVLGTAPRPLTSVDVQSAIGSQDALPAQDSQLEQPGDREVAMDRGASEIKDRRGRHRGHDRSPIAGSPPTTETGGAGLA